MFFKAVDITTPMRPQHPLETISEPMFFYILQLLVYQLRFEPRSLTASHFNESSTFTQMTRGYLAETDTECAWRNEALRLFDSISREPCECTINLSMTISLSYQASVKHWLRAQVESFSSRQMCNWILNFMTIINICSLNWINTWLWYVVLFKARLTTINFQNCWERYWDIKITFLFH